MRYRTESISGDGEVLNISSSGVFITTRQDLPEGATVELQISWPVLLNEAVPLNLVAVGPVVRAESGKAAVKIHKYEFRTSRAAMRRLSGIPEPHAMMAAVKMPLAARY